MRAILTLPSDSGSDRFPDNKTSQFRVSLPHELNFVGAYEVGLCQVQYPRSWYNLPPAVCRVGLRYRGPNQDLASRRGFIYVRLPPGYYADGAALVAQLNTVLWQGMKEAWGFARKNYLGYTQASN